MYRSKQIANKCNDYFSTIAEKLQSRIYHEGHDFTKYLSNSNSNSFFIRPTSDIEIKQVINKMIYNKASGLHSLPKKILHLIKEIIADPLSRIVNLSFRKVSTFRI